MPPRENIERGLFRTVSRTTNERRTLPPLPAGEGWGEGETNEWHWTAMLKQSPQTTYLARNLRERESWGERLMWSWLRARRFANYKFRRQHPVGPHILDFFCNEAKLDIEVDGFQHGSPTNRGADNERDVYLETRGIKVLRFWSSRLRRDKESIRETIWQALQQRAPHPLPDYCQPAPVLAPGNRES